MKFGVVVFPGSNCDHDAQHAIGKVLGSRWNSCGTSQKISPVWTPLSLPGGFAYGDYLRTGAIARFSPVMRAVRQFAAGGGLVLGICNGFQILLEAGLLPGAVLRNAGCGSSAARCISAWKPPIRRSRARRDRIKC